jgi:curli biogenesis system outer membrane secretion channel CsgG
MRKAIVRTIIGTLVTAGALGAQATPPAPAAPATPAPKRRVAVLDFDYATVHTQVNAVFGMDVDIGKGIADMVVTDLVKNGTYSVIERKKLDEVMKEQNFQQSGRADPSSAAQLAKILGVDAIIIGSITQFGRDDKSMGVGAGAAHVGGFGIGGVGTKSSKAVVVIDARIISTTTAEILDVASGKGESSRSGLSLGAAGGGGGGAGGGAFNMQSSNFGATIIGEATRNAVDSVSLQLIAGAPKVPQIVLPIQALVADVSGNEIIINVGTSAGVRVGGEYDVVRPGREIKDPATGKVLKHATTPVGKLKITAVEDGSATGTLTGGPAKVGDCVGTCPAKLSKSK